MTHIVLVKKSTHWKDKAVGYHKWQGVVKCSDCNKEAKATIWGTRDSALAYSGPCDKCAK